MLRPYYIEDYKTRWNQKTNPGVSFAAACLFCIDMNSYQHEAVSITQDELMVLQGGKTLEDVHTFSERERLAIQSSANFKSWLFECCNFMDGLSSKK